MPKVKVPRKSTTIDMTAMCDVAFLLLSFFILTTKFKTPDPVQVTTPKSVSTKIVEQENAVLVTMDKEGKVYFSVADENKDQKSELIDMIDQSKALNLTAAEKKAFLAPGNLIGVPFTQLKSYLQLSPEQIKAFKAPGIPVDSANNQLVDWIRAATTAFQGKTMRMFVKGDNDAKYPSFKGIIDALKKNELFKFSMITDPEGVPPGTDLFKRKEAIGAKATDE
ncbi:biopolymer transporter ExbD [Pseudoflavitalea sp. X16]|uniref:ExbD/TolR family protein n=1 Tax=Paraflavitalea devenefica TaxID=2716334 RepID=UPI00141F389B|nr:biopolymer transporter ExbD [Paraflavitalea devenefica]NII25141.1 biopolymer transporter ExbD [Paraflavitalea devenefica]